MNTGNCRKGLSSKLSLYRPSLVPSKLRGIRGPRKGDGQGGRNRRRAPRLSSSGPLPLQYRTAGGRYLSSSASCLGTEGLRFLCHQPLNAETRLDLVLSLDGTGVKVEAEWVWQKPVGRGWEVGVRFLTPCGRDLLRLQEWVNARVA